MKDRYEKLELLGTGGFGEVWCALDRHYNKKVAQKFLRDHNADAVLRFEREARMLVRMINNQHVVDLLDEDFQANPPYIVLEYCEHGSLRTWVRSRRPWKHVAIALSQVLFGLHAIHGVGGFHRDIKPENLLLADTPDGNGVMVKVADFGLARVPETVSGNITCSPMGTRGYMAPELTAGGGYSAKGDVFSLGVVATELLTGSTELSALASADIPPALRNLVVWMRARDPGARPGAAQVAAELEKILRPPPAPAPASALIPAPALVPNGDSSPGLAGLIIGGLALGAAIGALAGLARGDEEWDANVQRYRGTDGKFRK